MKRQTLYSITHLTEVNSTNLYLKRLIENGLKIEEGTVVITNYQTKGRGQMGNSWFADPNYNLLFSVLIQPVMVKPMNQFVISRMISVAIQKTLSQYVSGIKIKWPNDIYYGNKKVGGILIENILQGHQIVNSIVGVGLNINQPVFPDYLPNPISLRQICGKELEVEKLLCQILDRLFLLYDVLRDNKEENFEEEYKSHLYQLNERKMYKDDKGVFEGLITDVLLTGHLEVEHLTSGERKLYAFKEIEFIIEN